MKKVSLLLFMLVSLVVVVSSCGQAQPTETLPRQEKSPPAVVEEPPKGNVATDDAEEGKVLFISKACAGCHTIKGIPEAQGKVGPELTHQASNPLIVGVLPNTEENLKKYLKDPAAVKPGALMPNQYLTDSEIEALVAFLRTLK